MVLRFTIKSPMRIFLLLLQNIAKIHYSYHFQHFVDKGTLIVMILHLLIESVNH